MTQSKVITASLEGARIIIDDKFCQLQEYSFVQNHWYATDEAMWPLQRPRACLRRKLKNTGTLNRFPNIATGKIASAVSLRRIVILVHSVITIRKPKSFAS